MQSIDGLLATPHAPQGDPSSDLQAALYAVIARYKIDFGNPGGVSLVPYFLNEIGYRGTDLPLDSDYSATLSALVGQGAIIEIRKGCWYAPADGSATARATVRGRKRGSLDAASRDAAYVYCVNDPEGNELVLHTTLMLMPGDEVECCMVSSQRCAYALELTKKRRAVLGRLRPVKAHGMVAELMPDEPALRNFHFAIPGREELGGAVSGDVVIAEIVSRSASGCEVRVREVVRDLGNLNGLIVMATMRHDIPASWPEETLAAAERVPSEVGERDLAGRRDLRGLPLVTIDGEDARDFDDAVYARREGDGYRLFVAIADVSYYVRPGAPLDREAVDRTTSVYFPNFVIPMLPERLSNGICSLNPGVDRLCMVCEMALDAHGVRKGFEFYPAVMNSHGRLTYTEAALMINEGRTDVAGHEGLVGDVRTLHELYLRFKAAREARGGISIEGDEVHFVFDENLDIKGIEPLVRNDAHMLIEECMIAANVAAAEFVKMRKSETLYRIHPQPTDEKLETLRAQIARYGLTLGGNDHPQPRDYASLAREVAGREERSILSEFLLRSMSKASYHPDNIGHFGLALENYAHFTSPIRRYPDLQLHRVIKQLLGFGHGGKGPDLGGVPYTHEDLVRLGAHCTEREIAADLAEREVDTDLKLQYLKGFIGQALDGIITACADFGAFVRLSDFLIDGMVFIGNFGDHDRYYYNQKLSCISSPSGNVRYYAGDPIRVVLAAIDFENRKIDLVPEQGAPSAARAARAARAQG
ncbi:MAG: ribonuclease R, partial [Succinivibrionaceae bacterium]|nr:ribonuclease R [Succinivibrionaceae bacterium]